MQPVQATSDWAESSAMRDAGQVNRSSSSGPTTLYRKYRPTSFDAAELVGQDHIVRTLRNAVALQRVAHAYLFYGPRGTGKTTTARILAKAMNCLHEGVEQRPCNTCVNCIAINNGSTPDIIEIDAASNRGIDDIRELRDRVRFAPTQLASKVYIIDEAHQITGAAANAFLKTLEEPPGHSVFILATTDPEELLPTIVSRCQRYEFRRIDAESMRQRLRAVAEAEQIAIDDEALELVARQATGSLRDGLGLLERLSVQANVPGSPRIAIDARLVRDSLGLSHNERIDAMLEALAERRTGDALDIVQGAVDDGEDPRQLNRQIVEAVRELMLTKAQSDRPGSEQRSAALDRLSILELARMARRFSEIDFTIRHSPYPNLPLEIAIVELTTEPPVSGAVSAPSPRVDTAEQPAHQAESPAPARPYSLRDRVRNPEAARESRSAPAAAERMETRQAGPAPITPIRPEPTEPGDSAATGVSHADVGVDYIADLWPSVRADVKAINRRVEALLSEVDPVAISGNQITLAVPYAFHRDKLNTDDVRETVSSVLSRLLGRTMTFSCVLRGELPTPGIVSTSSPPTPTNDVQHPVSTLEQMGAPESEEVAKVNSLDSTVRAALNIFDAEEIEATDFPLPVEGQA